MLHSFHVFGWDGVVYECHGRDRRAGLWAAGIDRCVFVEGSEGD